MMAGVFSGEPDEETGLLHGMGLDGGAAGYDMPSQPRHRRLISRNAAGQSSGGIAVRKRIKHSDRWALYGTDWFHSLIDAPTWRVVLILLATYVGIVWVFAVAYYRIAITDYCSLDFRSFVGAFDFSMETMATIGYGTLDPYFSDCYSVAIVLALQMCVRLIVEGLTIGVVYCRLARPHRRASTIIFSQQAVLRRIRGKVYLMFQLCELRKHQLVEAHVRLYVVKKEVDRSGQRAEPFLQTSVLRLNHPNDELGSMLLLMVPQVVVHELDMSSPLMPPPLWVSAADGRTVAWDPPAYRHLKKHQQAPAPASDSRKRKMHPAEDVTAGAAYDPEALSALEFPNVSQRGSTSSEVHGMHSQHEVVQEEVLPRFDIGGVRTPPRKASKVAAGSGRPPLTPPRGNCTSPVRRPLTPTPAPIPTPMSSSAMRLESPGLSRYCKEMQMGLQGTATGYQQQACEEDMPPAWQAEEKAMIQAYMLDRQIEVIAIVEGIDSATGGNVQARQSYTSAEIQWDKSFEYCIFEDPMEDYCTTIDFDAFHKLRDVPKDAAFPGAIPSCI